MRPKKAPGPIKKGTFSRLMKYLFSHYPVRLIITIFCIVFAAMSSAAISIFMQRLIDEVITPGLSSGLASVLPMLLSIMVTLGIIYVIGVIAAWLQGQLMATVCQGTLRDMRNDMFDKMQTLPIRFFDTHAHGDIMSTYTNDTDAIRMMISQSLPMIVQSILTIVVLIVMMLYYSVALTLVVLAFMVLMIFIIKKVGGASAKYMMAQQIFLAKQEGFVEEMMEGQKVVKVFTHEEESKKTFDQLNEDLFKASTEANIQGNILMPILGNVGNLLYVLIAIVGGLMVFFQASNLSLSGFGAVSIGVVVTYLGMSRQLSQTIGQASMQVNMIAMALAGAGRVFELIDQEPEHDDGFVSLVNALPDSDGKLKEADYITGMWAWKVPNKETGNCEYIELKGDVRLKDVDFGYVPEKTVLHDVSLFAKPGQKIAFVGATGAGKTTITNLINRFYDIQDGQILYDGIDIKNIRKQDLRRSLGIVLQDVNLFTGTVMDNIRYGRLDATDEECIAAATLANADGFISRLPDGYNTVLTHNGGSLSQGQRQLISIARAAVANPPVMILDEATSSIDTRTESLVQAGMDNLMAGRTVFVIAHRLSTVRNSQAIMVLDHGRIIERGDHDTLIEQKGVYYQLYTGAFELE